MFSASAIARAFSNTLVAVRATWVVAPVVASLATALAAVSLAGCAIRPMVQAPVQPRVQGRFDGVVRPGPRLAALVSIAESEWMRWGAQVVQLDSDGHWCALTPSGQCRPVDDGCGREQMPGWCEIVDEYWALTRAHGGRAFRHDCSRVGQCADARTADQTIVDTPAWSAAWISAIMHRSGFAGDGFPVTAYHADYVTAARDARLANWTIQSLPTAASPGDLACSARVPEATLASGGAAAGAPRSVAEPVSIASLRASGEAAGPTPMHCDLVVDVDLASRTATVVGGNVMQAVSLMRLPLDAQGRLRPESGGQRPLLLLMKMSDAARAR